MKTLSEPERVEIPTNDGTPLQLFIKNVPFTQSNWIIIYAHCLACGKAEPNLRDGNYRTCLEELVTENSINPGSDYCYNFCNEEACQEIKKIFQSKTALFIEKLLTLSSPRSETVKEIMALHRRSYTKSATM